MVARMARAEPILFAILLIALLLDAVVGDPERLRRVHPVALAGRLIGWLERKLNRTERTDRDRRARGVVLVAFLILGGGVIGWAIHHWLLFPYGWLIEAAVVAVFIAQRGLFDHVLAVALGLDQGLAQGRAAVRHIVGRDPDSLDRAGVSRAAIESLFENLSDGVIAPAFWYLVGGLPGLIAYKLLNTADSMIGHRDDRYHDFGWAAARADTVANFVPARLTALMIALAAAFFRWGSPFSALAAMFRDAGNHRSFNAGWPEAAAAGALGLRLAGPRVYGGTQVHDAWMGKGRIDATANDIRRALKLFVATCAVHGAAIMLLSLRWQRIWLGF